jgi:hypothetical protein
MGSHLIDGEFQSDKYPTCPAGKVPLSTKDPLAQDLLWIYAQRRRAQGKEGSGEFSDDLEAVLALKGFKAPPSRALPFEGPAAPSMNMNWMFHIAAKAARHLGFEAMMTIDGQSYNVLHMFSALRAVIAYSGTAVLVDKGDDGTWALSGVPASPEELPFTELFSVPSDTTVVTETKE